MENDSNNNSIQSGNSSKKNSFFNWAQIIGALVVGILLGIGGSLILQGQKIAKLETQIEELNKSRALVPPHEEPNDEHIQSQVNPEDLIKIIKDQQASYVKESWGTEGYQCFTDVDYNNFINSKIPEKVLINLKKDNKFIDVVLAIKQMPSSKWQELKELCLKTYKPTWAEQGSISRSGQTDAGQKAEKMIAQTVVKLVVELLNKTDDDIKKLYSY
jgi:hypothetical protein